MTPLRSLTVDLTGLNDVTDTLLGIGALIALVVGWIKVLRPRWRRARAKFTAAVDSLVGRPPIVDSASGKELSPALPGIGVRMEHIESLVATLVDQGAAITELREASAQHAKDIAILQAAVVERVASKVEQTEMWRAVQRIQDEDPAADGEALDDPTHDE